MHRQCDLLSKGGLYMKNIVDKAIQNAHTQNNKKRAVGTKNGISLEM